MTINEIITRDMDEAQAAEKLQRGKPLPDDDAVWVDVVIGLFVGLCAVVGIIGICKAITAIFN